MLADSCGSDDEQENRLRLAGYEPPKSKVRSETGGITKRYNPGVPTERSASSELPSDSPPPATVAVEAQLQKILSGDTFSHSPQLCRFLQFVVDQELAGKGDQIKEYVLGVEVFRKDESFDPRVDTAVRTEARRLRQKLAEYYQSEGRQDAIEITLPKGGYRAAFHSREEAGRASAVPPRAAPGGNARVSSGRWLMGVALMLAVSGFVWLSVGALSTPRLPSIAVIPLENLSNDSEQEYFSDGMTDSLFTDLAKFHGLSVISRTSMMQYKRTKKAVPEIARELKVDYVVEGTVTRSGSRVRISAQLIEVRSDRHIWAESYERDVTDVLGLQGELAGAIAEQVHIHVTPQEKARLGGRTPSPEAQDLYLKGRFNWQLRGTERLRNSLDYFQQAIAKEPQYALAYAGLADAYNVLSYTLDRKDYHSRGCEAVKKALDLDDNLAEAHASMDGCLDLWDWKGREWHLRRATELSPSYATAHQWLGELLIDVGRDKEGLAEVRRALALDPIPPGPNSALCFAFYKIRQYDRAVTQCLQTLEVFPRYEQPYFGLGFAYSGEGRYAEAITTLEKAMAMTSGAPPAATLLAHVRALAGDASASRRLIQEYATRTDVSPMMLVAIYLDVGDKDKIFELLNRAVDERSFASDWINVNPGLDGLRGDPRWVSLLRKMNLPN